MFLNILTVTSIFIHIVRSDEGDLLWDVKLAPLQLYNGEIWIPICFGGLDMAVAHVACRQKGFTNATTYKSFEITQIFSPPISEVTCPTVSNYFLYGETNIMHCNFSQVFHSCLSADITCNTDTIKETNPYEGQIYLDKTGTDTPADGVVEVYLDNNWYRVCINSFTDTVADSICRQYGYTGCDSWNTVEPASSVKSVIVTEYTCTNETGSFECFSHCIPSNYFIGSCHNHVTVKCKFDINAKYITSGSQSQCAFDEGSQCAVDDCSHLEGSLQTYRIITAVLSSLLLFCVLVLFIIAFWFFCKKKCCSCCRKYDDLDHGRFQVDGDRNDL